MFIIVFVLIVFSRGLPDREECRFFPYQPNKQDGMPSSGVDHCNFPNLLM